MKPFLNLFGVEYGNGPSTFDIDMDVPCNLIKLIKYFLHPPNRYPRDTHSYDDFTEKIDNGEEEDVDANPPGDIIPGFAADIQSLNLD